MLPPDMPPEMPPPGGMPPTAPPPGAPPMMTAPPPAPKFHDVTIVRKRKIERARVQAVPPEEFGISRFARSITDTGYCFHDVIRREADLIADGWDAEQVKELDTYNGLTNAEEISRDTVDEQTGQTGDQGLNTANREIKITEHYIKLDYEGDGKACLYRITTGGAPSVILKRNGSEEILRLDGPAPFAAITPVPIPHRFYGRSAADLVMDIMRIKTALVRGLLDNIYRRNNPRTEVSETHAGQSTLDDLLTNRPDGIVRTKQPGGLVPIMVEDVTAPIYPALQYFDATREWRTGVSRQGQGVNPDALQNQVATIANQMEDAAQIRVKLIARIFAETGIKDMFSLLHQTIRKHGSQAQTVRLKNKWVNVDPREWKSRNDMTINVGLGTGNKTQQMAGLNLLIEKQIAALPVGMVSARNLYNSARELTKLVRPGADVQTFFTEPGSPPNPKDPASAPLPPPPDPKAAQGQAQMQLEQFKAQAQQQNEQVKLQAQMASDQQRLQLEKIQGEADAAVQASKTQHEAALENLRFEHQRQLAIMQHQMDVQKHEQAMRHAETKHRVETGSAMMPEDAMPQITAAMQAMGEALGAHQQKLGDALTKHAETVHALISAPKEVVRYPKGHPLAGRVAGSRIAKNS